MSPGVTFGISFLRGCSTDVKQYVMLLFLVLYLVISYIMFVYSWANVSVTVVTFSSSSIATA